MVRNYKKKRIEEVNESEMADAVLAVVNGSMTQSQAAKTFNIKPNTLHYRIKNYKENLPLKSQDYTTKYTVKQIFNNEEEKLLKKYLLKSSKMNYGLTYKQTRVLALEYATALEKCPTKWTENKEAGIEWLKGFMKRHKELTIRKPENTSLSRATSFNKHNVMQFYDNYEKVLKKTNFSPVRIFNIDETSILTVVQAPKIIAETGAKQVGQCVSAERGQLITMCAIVNAIGNALPPVFIFPRAKFHDSMLFGAPVGSIGFANSPKSGWMTGPLFLNVLKHLQNLTRCTKDDPILLLMDNHESHCSLEAINYCRENGIVVLTFPPHCTHRLQPLDVAVMGPFKTKLAVQQNDWLTSHPGKTITIHDLASLVRPAYNISFVTSNIIAGFAAPGIFPFSRNAFSDDDFECAEVTNRPLPSTPLLSIQPSQAEILPETCPIIIESPTLVTDDDLTDCEEELALKSLSNGSAFNSQLPTSAGLQPSTSLISDKPQQILSPESVRPFPRAPARKESHKGRKKGRSRILTDTPEKNEVEKLHNERQARLIKIQTSRQKKQKKIETTQLKNKPKKRKQTQTLFSSSDESDTEIVLESEEDIDSEENELEDDNEPEIFEDRRTKIGEGDYLLVKFSSSNKRTLAFVGKVVECNENSFVVMFLKRKGKSYNFIFPDKEDISYINFSDIITKLPSPILGAGTSRTAAMISYLIFQDLF